MGLGDPGGPVVLVRGDARIRCVPAGAAVGLLVGTAAGTVLDWVVGEALQMVDLGLATAEYGMVGTTLGEVDIGCGCGGLTGLRFPCTESIQIKLVCDCSSGCILHSTS